jgi:16S rRNA (uracil1498-N3)-methyltransferase
MSTRRAYIDRLTVGELVLSDPEAKHIRDVLRLGEGDAVELFDDVGNTSQSTLKEVSKRQVVVRVDSIAPARATRKLTVVSAIPKGERADWMIEKLSELGVTDFQPVVCKRSVVEPGQGKLDRWKRIAIEAAKQSQRVGVMRIQSLINLDKVTIQPGCVVLTTHQSTTTPLDTSGILQLVVGPEGGFDESEIQLLLLRGASPVRLPAPILRVETAAIVAAGIVLCQSANHR